MPLTAKELKEFFKDAKDEDEVKLYDGDMEEVDICTIYRRTSIEEKETTWILFAGDC